MRRLVSLLLLMTFSAGTVALGLGNIQLNSGLNQPFDARIELLSPTSAEIESLNIRVADVEAFERAGIEWTLLVNSLRFEIEINETGSDYVHITSREAIREPYLNFLLQASWSSGRLFREYTVLLDPPLYDPGARGRVAPAASAPLRTSPAPVRTPEPSSAAAPSPSSTARSSSYSGNDFGPVGNTDTLWSIANRVRPDSSISVQQMMLALLRSNPQAFIENNINGLRLGQILRIPGRDEITSTSAAAAMAEVRSQNAMWEEVRATFAGSASQRAIGAGSQPGASVPGASAATGSELRLVAPGAQTNGSGQSAAAPSSSSQGGTELALANEELASLSSENTELRSRLQESETIIQDLKRLLELKDDELASLQQQTAGAGAGDEMPPTAEPPETGGQEQAEGIVSLEIEETPDESVVPEPVEAPVEEAAPAPPPVQVTTQTETMGTGLVDEILSFVFANIMLVGGALAALILGLVGFTFVKKRQAAEAEDDGAAPITEFPDFEEDADETGMSATAEDIEIGETEEEDNVYKTAFIGEMESAELAEDVAEPAAAAEPEAAEEPEEDPLAEVNVFLAYEHFDQAEQFVRDAIEKDPRNLEFHNKLLEVFYSSGDKVKYEEEARVLNELVGGEGPHWEMAEIMWQEISPNRALFSEPVEGEDEDESADDTKSGIVDLTADDASEENDDGALDFDLGMDDTGGPESYKDGGMLDITSGSDDVLDLTTGSGTDSDDDLLDVTAAVGLGTADESASSAGEEDILDISASPSGDDDLLDVTATSDIDSDDGEDLLDVTAAVDLSGEEDIVAEPAEEELPAADDNSLDFDIGGLEIEDAEGEPEQTSDESVSDDNIIEFESGTSDSDNDEGGELDISIDEGGDDEALELDMGGDNSDAGLEISLDEGGDDEGIKLDFSSEDEAQDESEISLDMGDEDTLKIDMNDEMSLDQEDDGVPEIDMESTYKLSKDDELSLDSDEEASPEAEQESTMQLDQEISLDLDEDDDDDDDHTVFVPRTSDNAEQSVEDEVATKLDLAKAYVELGDNDSAKTILDEVIAEGNDAQRQQAEELKGQID